MAVAMNRPGEKQPVPCLSLLQLCYGISTLFSVCGMELLDVRKLMSSNALVGTIGTEIGRASKVVAQTFSVLNCT